MKKFLLLFFIFSFIIAFMGFHGSLKDSGFAFFVPCAIQNKSKAQGKNMLFEDFASDRKTPYNAVKRGSFNDYENVFSKDYNPEKNNIQILKPAVLFKAHCTPCHGFKGDGKGKMYSYGFISTPSFSDQTIKEQTIKEIQNTIYAGKNAMPSLAFKLTKNQQLALAKYIKETFCK